MKPAGLILAVYAAAAFAQAPQGFNKSPASFRKIPLIGKLFKAKPKMVAENRANEPCSIPLRNVLRGATPSRMPVMVPEGTMRQVPMPAPPCEDTK